MDELQDYELDILCENIGWTYKNEWEIARINSYCAISAFGKPKKSLMNFFPLPTDKDNTYKVRNTSSITEDDIDKIETQKTKILNYINNGTNRN